LDFNEEVVLKYKLMVCRIGWQHTSDPTLHEDLVQEGMLGLKKACETFDPTLGVVFSTHAYNKVRGEIMRYINYKVKTVHVPVAKGETSSTTELTDESTHHCPDFWIDLGDAISSIRDRELRNMAGMVLIMGMNRREISESTGIHYERVKKLCRRAIGLVRERML